MWGPCCTKRNNNDYYAIGEQRSAMRRQVADHRSLIA
jgi:hypothetical protein